MRPHTRREQHVARRLLGRQARPHKAGGTRLERRRVVGIVHEQEPARVRAQPLVHGAAHHLEIRLLRHLRLVLRRERQGAHHAAKQLALQAFNHSRPLLQRRVRHDDEEDALVALLVPLLQRVLHGQLGLAEPAEPTHHLRLQHRLPRRHHPLLRLRRARSQVQDGEEAVREPLEPRLLPREAAAAARHVGGRGQSRSGAYVFPPLPASDEHRHSGCDPAVSSGCLDRAAGSRVGQSPRIDAVPGCGAGPRRCLDRTLAGFKRLGEAEWRLPRKLRREAAHEANRKDLRRRVCRDRAPAHGGHAIAAADYLAEGGQAPIRGSALAAVEHHKLEPRASGPEDVGQRLGLHVLDRAALGGQRERALVVGRMRGVTVADEPHDAGRSLLQQRVYRRCAAALENVRRAAGAADYAGERVRLVKGLGEGRTARRADDDQHVDQHVGAWTVLLFWRLRPRFEGEAVEHRADEVVEPHDCGIAGVWRVWAAAGDGANERHFLLQLLEWLVAHKIGAGN